jgi:hypothetical protein
MPAWPVAVQAAFLKDPSAPAAALLAQVADGPLNICYNYTGQAGVCFNTTSSDPPGVQGCGGSRQLWGVGSVCRGLPPRRSTSSKFAPPLAATFSALAATVGTSSAVKR